MYYYLGLYHVYLYVPAIQVWVDNNQYRPYIRQRYYY